MTCWFARPALWLVLLSGALLPAFGGTYPLVDGSTLEGDPISYNAQGVVVKKPDGTFAPRAAWTNFTQEALKLLAKEAKAKPFVEVFVELDEPELDKKPAIEIKPKAFNRLPRPEAKAGMGSTFSSSLTVFILLVVWAGNIYAGFEIGIFRNYHPGLVAGIAAVAPVLGPVVFLCLPTRVHKSRDELAAESMAEHAAEAEHLAHALALPSAQQLSAAAAAAEAKPKVTVYQRGQTTFNRRFFETKFAGFLKVVPGDAEKDMVVFIRSARGEHSGTRLTRILQNELHLQVSKAGATADVIIPFNEIHEVQVRPKEA